MTGTTDDQAGKPAKQRETILMLYLGIIPLKGGDDVTQRRYQYVELAEEGNNGEPLPSRPKILFFTKLLHHKSLRPGSIVKIEAERNETDGRSELTVFGTGKYHDTWKHRADVMKYQAMHDAFEQHAARVKKAKENMWAQELEPLRQAYRNGSWQARQELLAMVIRHITS